MRATFLFLLTLITSLGWGQVAYETDRFDVNIVVATDRSLTVTERILVRFREARRGLVRTLPIVVKGKDSQRTVIYEEISVLQNGAQIPIQQESKSGTLSLRIGDPNRQVTGTVVYDLTYRVRGALSNIGKNDDLGPRVEMLWNAFPSAWPTAVEGSRITISYPDPVTDTFGVRALFGPVGNRAGTEQYWGKPSIGRLDLLTVKLPSRTQAEVDVHKRLEKGYGVTVILALPKGTVATPDDSIITRSNEGMRDFVYTGPNNPLGWFVPFLPLAFVIPWVMKRRNPKPGPLVVRFDPPDGVDAMRAGVLFDGQFQPRDFLAGVVASAQKGAARIQVVDKEMTIHLTGLRPTSLSAMEGRLIDELTPYGPDVTPDALRGQFSHVFRAFEMSALRDMVDEGWRRENPNSALMGCVAFSAVLVCSCAGAFFLGPPACFGAVLAIIALLILFRFPSPWTALGARKKWELEGLREFILRAHKDPLEFAARSNPDAAMYERVLPFAIAFGLVREWSRAFEGLDLPTPEWFDGGGLGYGMWWYGGGFYDASNDWSGAVSDGGSWASGDSGTGGDFTSGGGFDGGGGFDDGGSVGDGGGGGGGGDW